MPVEKRSSTMTLWPCCGRIIPLLPAALCGLSGINCHMEICIPNMFYTRKDAQHANGQLLLFISERLRGITSGSREQPETHFLIFDRQIDLWVKLLPSADIHWQRHSNKKSTLHTWYCYRVKWVQCTSPNVDNKRVKHYMYRSDISLMKVPVGVIIKDHLNCSAEHFRNTETNTL